jgi:taurine transport system substrate-binding protein
MSVTRAKTRAVRSMPVLALVTTALLIGSAGWSGAADDRIRIGWQPALSPGVHSAMLGKLYEAEGLSPEHIKFEAGPPMFSALASGDLDVAYMSVYPVIFGLAQKLDVKIFAVIDDFISADGLIVRRGGGISSIADQKGKRVAVTFGSAAHFGLLRSLQKVGLAERDLTILDMAPSVIQAAFIRSDIDGAWIWEPWLVKLEKEGGTIVATFKELDAPVATVWIARSAFLRERPNTVQKFLRAWDRTVRTDLTPEFFRQLGRVLSLTPEMARVAVGRVDPLTMGQQLGGHPSSMGTSETKGASGLYKQLREFSQFLYQQKKIKDVPDLLTAIDPGPMEQYLQKR